MPSTLGTALRVTVFGQSHSPAVGCVVEGLPSGMLVDHDALSAFVARRAPGSDPWGTPRKEPDAPRIVSGLNPRGETCGAPLTAIIENTNTRSGDYDNILAVPRPGHADFAAWAKWHGAQDVPGGGHFSGRLTAPLCVAGGIALQWLEQQGVSVRAHVSELAGIEDTPFSALDNSPSAAEELSAQMAALADGRRVPTLDADAGARMVEAVLAARAERDTVGGIVECVATGLPSGAGSPMFDGVENVLARALFGIPSVKGVEFGRGFEAARMRGTLRRWLSWPGGGNLILPDDPEVEYRDAILVGASDWSNLFEAGECTLTFTLSTPLPADSQPLRCIVTVLGAWPTGSTLKVEVCNNANDSAPTWEDITSKVLARQKHYFANSKKTAAAWAVNMRVTLTRGSASGDCYIESVSGNFA